MARPQVYRGNPELKQTVLFDNFSGGMNTTSIDDQMLSNEFRLLQNVELIEQGRIKKRKGFAEVELLTEILNTYESEFKNALEVYYVNLIRDEEFRKVLEVIYYDQNDGLVYEVIGSVQTSENWDTVQYYKAPDIPLKGDFQKANLTGLRILNYNGFKYFVSSDVFTNRFDIIKFGIDDNKNYVFEVMNAGNSFKPTPWDVGVFGEGFNLFSEEPHKHISVQNTSTKTIQGLVIAEENDDSKILSEIPKSGKFKLFVYYTGDILHDDLNIRFYQREHEYIEEKKYLDNVEVSSEVVEGVGYFIYDIDLGETLSGSISVDVTIEKDNSEEVESVIIPGVTAVSGLVNNFSNLSKPDKYYEINENAKSIRTYTKSTISPYEYIPGIIESYIDNAVKLDDKDSNYAYYNLNYKGTPNYSNNDKDILKWAGGILTKYVGKPVLNGQYADMQNAKYKYSHMTYPNSSQYDPNVDFKSVSLESSCSIENEVIQYHSTEYRNAWARHYAKCIAPQISYNALIKESETEIVTDLKLTNRKLQIIDRDVIYKIDDKFYKWNGGGDLSISDFDEVTEDNIEIILSFTMEYEISIADVPEYEKISKIDLTNAKGEIIKDRLVLFKENTIFWSSGYSTMRDSDGTTQQFTYLPNNNWATLSLSANDSIQAIKYYRGSHMIFTKESIYRMSGNFNQPDFEIVLVNDAIGCISPDSIRSFNNTLQFMSKDGLYIMKQNYYMDGMENVEKIDKLVTNIIPYGYNFESIMYNEQYWLIIKDKYDNYVKTVKQYYNMSSSNRSYPITVDVVSKRFNLLFKLSNKLYAVRNGKVYLYDEGFRDFGEEYNTVIETPHWSLGYPLHEKKFKNIFLNIESTYRKPIDFKLLFDKNLVDDYMVYDVKISKYGELEYVERVNDKYIFELTGKFVLNSEAEGWIGKDHLGEIKYQVHKINPSNKGRYIKLSFNIDGENDFAMDSINIVYKLGKMRERRG